MTYATGRLVAAWFAARHGRGDLELIVTDRGGGQNFAERFVQYLGNFIASYGVLLVPGALAAGAFGVAWLVRRFRREPIDALEDKAIILPGYVLAALPIFVGVAIFLLNREYVTLLFTHPLGKVMLVIAVIMQVMGYLWIRKIVNIEI